MPDVAYRRYQRARARLAQILASTASTCCICYDECESKDMGVTCGFVTHFICSGCFAQLVSASANESPEDVGTRAGHVVCPFVPAADPQVRCSRPYSDQLVARTVPPDVFELHQKAFCKWQEKEVVEAERQRIAAERAREEEAGPVQAAYVHVTEEILTLRCTECGQAFVDFVGCFAVKCGGCPSHFCGWCLTCFDPREMSKHVSTNVPYERMEDEQKRLADRLACSLCHNHVLHCGSRGEGAHGYHGSPEDFEDHHRERRRKQVRRYLSSLPQPIAEQVRHKLVRELTDLGIAADLTKPGA